MKKKHNWLVAWVLLYVHRNRRVIRDGEPRMASSTFTQLLGSEETQSTKCPDVQYRDWTGSCDKPPCRDELSDSSGQPPALWPPQPSRTWSIIVIIRIGYSHTPSLLSAYLACPRSTHRSRSEWAFHRCCETSTYYIQLWQITPRGRQSPKIWEF